VADFCKQCSYDMFGEDFKNLCGKSTEQQTKQHIYVNVICEGCGFTYVNHLGFCVNPNCLQNHGNNIDRWPQRQFSSR
jgi:hypothetical protein